MLWQVVILLSGFLCVNGCRLHSISYAAGYLSAPFLADWLFIDIEPHSQAAIAPGRLRAGGFASHSVLVVECELFEFEIKTR